jgi:hypothetical protein
LNANRRHNPQVGTGITTWGASKPNSFSEAFLNAIPGGLAWLSLLLVVLLALEAPLAMLFLASLLSFYSAVRFFFAALAVLIGLRKIGQFEQMDWQAEYTKRKTPTSLPLEQVQHLVIIPNYREAPETMRATLAALAVQAPAKTQVCIVLAMESGEEGAPQKGEALRAEFEGQFAHFFVALHPKGLHQEMQCKSANEAWAARWAKRRLTEELGYDIGQIVVTTMDADTLWHPDYLQALGVLFATNDDRYQRFWQAPIRYHNNVWQINPFMRILHGYSNCWELAYLAAPWWPALPMSSYSLSLKLLEMVGYWDPDVIADEWHMYIKAFFQRDGEIRLVPIFLPFGAYATGGEGLLDSFKERYEQTLRHAWGAKEIGYAIAQSQAHPQVPLMERFTLVFRVAHDNLLAGAGWIILTLGLQLPAVFHSEEVSTWSNLPLFWALQACALTITLISLLFWAIDVRTRPPRPAPMTQAERLQSALSLPGLTLVTLFCVALPVLHSQTRLMLGMPLQFRVTRKFFVLR